MSDSSETETELDKHSLSVKRSQGAKRKINNIKKYCKSTGYMGLLVLKPTWPRGKPRAMKTENFKGQILVPKRGLDGVGVGMAELESLNTVQENMESDSESVGQSGDVMGSPRSGRPMGKPPKKIKGKRHKQKEPVRCHACGEVYDEQSEEDGVLWIFCGGPGPRGKGCRAFAAHATCWNVAGGEKVVELISRRYIRCKDCQEIENETSEDDEDDSPAKRKSSASKRKSSSTDKKSSSSNQQTNRGASRSNSQSGSRRPSTPPQSDDDFQP